MVILYSTNTFLAYSIAEKYYDQTHYFWCTPCFDPRTAPALSVSLPPTASPAELYEDFANDIERSDRHSPRVGQNRTGIMAGATAHKNRGHITKKQFTEIFQIVHAAQLQDFRPLLFVAAVQALKPYVKTVPVTERAHPLAQEFVAEGVPRAKFDVIAFRWRK